MKDKYKKCFEEIELELKRIERSPIPAQYITTLIDTVGSIRYSLRELKDILEKQEWSRKPC